LSFDPKQVKGLQILEQIGIRSLEDEEFRRRLIDNPEEVLREEGLEVPDGVRVYIHENTDEELHLVLPSCRPPEHEVNVVKLFSAFHWI
jgi:1,2-phenylacetyl-CoA epoxidase catalytic subunit